MYTFTVVSVNMRSTAVNIFMLVAWLSRSHFGRNPARGGRPPKAEIKTIPVTAVLPASQSLMSLTLFLANVHRINPMLVKYTVMNRTSSWVLSRAARMIQAKLAIEEYAISGRTFFTLYMATDPTRIDNIMLRAVRPLTGINSR